MTIKAAAKQRHMVCKYTDKPVPTDIVELLNARITENNAAHGRSRLRSEAGDRKFRRYQGYGKMLLTKTAAEISRYNGTAPQWFTDGVDALLCAPTALNKHPCEVGVIREIAGMEDVMPALVYECEAVTMSLALIQKEVVDDQIKKRR